MSDKQFRILKSNGAKIVGRPQKGMRQPQKPEFKDFDHWFLDGIRIYESQGAEFTLYEPGIVKIQWPCRPAILRTVSDFRAEYDSLFNSSSVKFEENAGVTSQYPEMAVV